MKRAQVVAKRTEGTARKPPYRDPSLPAAKRVKDLLGRMTLEEKAAQMVCVWPGKIRVGNSSRDTDLETVVLTVR